VISQTQRFERNQVIGNFARSVLYASLMTTTCSSDRVGHVIQHLFSWQVDAFSLSRANGEKKESVLSFVRSSAAAIKISSASRDRRVCTGTHRTRTAVCSHCNHCQEQSTAAARLWHYSSQSVTSSVPLRRRAQIISLRRPRSAQHTKYASIPLDISAAAPRPAPARRTAAERSHSVRLRWRRRCGVVRRNH
jgi:hypothetical protein